MHGEAHRVSVRSAVPIALAFSALATVASITVPTAALILWALAVGFALAFQRPLREGGSAAWGNILLVAAAMPVLAFGIYATL